MCRLDEVKVAKDLVLCYALASVGSIHMRFLRRVGRGAAEDPSGETMIGRRYVIFAEALDAFLFPIILVLAKSICHWRQRPLADANTTDAVSRAKRHEASRRGVRRPPVVRYRYDAEKTRRYKTVELIIKEAAWEPQPTADTLMAIPSGR